MQKKANAYLLLATLLFSLMHILVKDLKSYPIYQLILFRAVISFIFCISELSVKKIHPWGTDKKLLLARGIFGVLSLSGFYYSLHHIPLGSAITVTSLRPIVILFLGGIFLGERVHKITWIFFLISFVGVIMIKGFDPRITGIEFGVLLLATIISCFSSIAVRKLKETDHPLVIVFYFSLITLPVCIPLAAYSWIEPDSYLTWMKLIGVGILTHFAQYFMTKGFHASKFSNMASFSYLGLLFAFAFGYFIFHETYPTLAYYGISLVIAGMFGIYLTKPKKTTH